MAPGNRNRGRLDDVALDPALDKQAVNPKAVQARKKDEQRSPVTALNDMLGNLLLARTVGGHQPLRLAQFERGEQRVRVISGGGLDSGCGGLGLHRGLHAGVWKLSLPTQATVHPHRIFCPHIEAALGTVVHTARCAAAAPPVAGADTPPRWTLRRLVGWVRERFGLRCCRETIRAALHRLDLSWKKTKKLLGRAASAKRQAFVGQVQDLLAGAQRDHYLLVYWDEAHIHQEADLGYGWSPRGQRFWVTSHSPGLSAKLSFSWVH